MNETNLLPELSEKSDVILTQLMNAKMEMGSSVKKDSSNPFHKSKYASLGAHLDLCEPVLFKYGILMIPTVNIINGQHILITALYHVQSGQWLKTYLPLHNPKNDSQGVGASLTYMRRYAINSLFSLNAEDDDGETASGRGKYEKQAEKESKNKDNSEEKYDINKKIPNEINASFNNVDDEKISSSEVMVLSELLKKLDADINENFLSWTKSSFNAAKVQDIPKVMFQKCLSSLSAKVKYVKDVNKQNQKEHEDIGQVA